MYATGERDNMKAWQKVLIKVFRVIEHIFTILLVVVLVAVIGAVYAPRLFGYRPYAVISGSMEPKYHVGCIVYVKDIPSSELYVGDSVTFNYAGMTVTHEIIEINREKNEFTTKGLANENTQEGPFPYSSIIGKASDFSIPYAGYILDWLVSVQAKIALITYIIVLFMIMTINKYLPSLFEPTNNEKKTVKEGDDNASEKD